jgi:hypothetical protein
VAHRTCGLAVGAEHPCEGFVQRVHPWWSACTDGGSADGPGFPAHRQAGLWRVDRSSRGAADVEEKLKRHKKLRVYYEFAADFAGIDPAAWEDTKVGISHFLSSERITVVADVAWIKQMTKILRLS